jgi:hypothetical protein
VLGIKLKSYDLSLMPEIYVDLGRWTVLEMIFLSGI